MALAVKNPVCQHRRHKRLRFNSWVRKIPLEGDKVTHSSIFLPRESHGQRSLVVGEAGQKESDKTDVT